ncbi:MAG: hypothetical protein ABSD98_19135 [Candidatus Korobacteraceae bacterium]
MRRSREGSEYIRKKVAQIELHKRLRELAALQPNWDDSGAEPPVEPAVSNASAFIDSFVDAGLIPDALTTSADGGVAICFVRSDRYADIECFNDGEVLAVRYSSTEDPKTWIVAQGPVAADATIQLLSTYLSA